MPEIILYPHVLGEIPTVPSIHTCSARFLRHMLWTIQFGLVYFAQCNSQDIGTYDGEVLAAHLQHMVQRVD